MVVFNLVSIVSILFSHLLDNKTTIIDGAAALGLGMVTIICTASQATIRSNAAAPGRIGWQKTTAGVTGRSRGSWRLEFEFEWLVGGASGSWGSSIYARFAVCHMRALAQSGLLHRSGFGWSGVHIMGSSMIWRMSCSSADTIVPCL